MKNAAVALVIATTLLTSPPVEARDRVSAGMIVSSTTAGLIASAQGEYRRGLSLATAPAIFGYGYRATYYGNGFSYQPAYYSPHAYYVGTRFRGCCRW
jgi:O-antigen ligase